jgi:hypothetical protein
LVPIVLLYLCRVTLFLSDHPCGSAMLSTPSCSHCSNIYRLLPSKQCSSVSGLGIFVYIKDWNMWQDEFVETQSAPW